ncbi:MAG: Thioredoxin reductase, partial [uncultured Solirubrobacteraceae bacterium]
GDDGGDRPGRPVRGARLRAARAAVPGGGGRPPRSRRVRRARGRRARAVRGAGGPHRTGQAGRRDRARRRSSEPGRHLRRGPHRARHRLPRRLPRRRGLAGHADRGARLPRGRGAGARRRPGGRAAGVASHERAAGPAGHRGGAATSAGDRRRAPLGRLLHRPAALPRAQSGDPQVAHAGRAGSRRPLGWAAAGRRGPTGDPGRGRQDGHPAEAAQGGGSARPRHRGRRRRIRHGHRGRRAGGPRGRGVRSLGGASHHRGGARGARRPGRHVLADRELPRLPVRRVGRGAREPCPAAGAKARGRDPGDALHRADRRRITSAAPRRRRRPAGADDHPRVRCHVAAAAGGRVRPIGRQGRLLRRRPQRGGQHPWPRRPRGGRRQLGRPGRPLLLHPRPDGHDPLPWRLARAQHVALPGRPAGCAPEHRRAVRRRGRGGARRLLARGDRPSGAGDRRDGSSRLRGALPVHRRRRPDGVASARDRPRPSGLRADRLGHARDGTLDARARSLPAGDERAGHLRVRRCAPGAGQAGRRRRRRGQHGHRLRAPVPQGRPGRRRGVYRPAGFRVREAL